MSRREIGPHDGDVRKICNAHKTETGIQKIKIIASPQIKAAFNYSGTPRQQQTNSVLHTFSTHLLHQQPPHIQHARSLQHASVRVRLGRSYIMHHAGHINPTIDVTSHHCCHYYSYYDCNAADDYNDDDDDDDDDEDDDDRQRQYDEDIVIGRRLRRSGTTVEVRRRWRRRRRR